MCCGAVLRTDSLQTQTCTAPAFPRAPELERGWPPVTITSVPTAAALRTRTLSAVASPFGLSAHDAGWREQAPGVRIPTGMQRTPAFGPLNHNSITAATRTAVVLMADVPPADAGRAVYNATKQAGPPRGAPR
jgi:hypothetical protein